MFTRYTYIGDYHHTERLVPNWDANDMKFGKNIGRVVELSDPEWSPFWINYKFLKKKVKVCVLRWVVASTFFQGTPQQ